MASYRSIPATSAVRLAKPTSNLFRARAKRDSRGLDTSGLTGVLGVDPENRTADVAGMCTYEDLVAATLPYGLSPLVVPQLKTITLGGAVTGLGIESASFRNGLPHESVLEMDILTGAGELLTASRGEHADLFRAFPNSYGTLGYSTRLRIELEPVAPFVTLRHIRFRSLPEMVAAMDKVGVDGAIFISAFSMYRYDASYAVEVQRAHPGRLAIVKPVDPDDPAVADAVADWKQTPGTVGIRIMMTKEANRAPSDPGLDRIVRAAVRHDFPVNMLCWGNLDDGMAIVDRHPEARFIIDHLAILQPRTPPAPPNPWADLPKVLELAKRPNAVIKVSGACTLSRQAYPFPDIWDPLARVFEAWGFDRCLWGTDWTRAFAVVNYQQAVEPFLKTDRLSDGERAMLMGGACAKAYGWSPAP